MKTKKENNWVSRVQNLFTKKSNKNGAQNRKPTISHIDVDFKTVKVDSLDNQYHRYEQHIHALEKEVGSLHESIPLSPPDQIAERINNACTATDGKILRGLNQQKFNMENTKSFAMAKLNELDSEVKRQINQAGLLLDQASKQKAEDDAEIETMPLRNEYDMAKKEAIEKETQLNELVHGDYKNKAPLSKSVLNNSSVYALAVTSLAFADSIFNYTAMQGLAEALPNWMVLVLSAILGVCIAASAHFAGATVKSQNRIEFKAILFIAASLFGVIVLLRFNGGAAFELTIMNGSIFGLAGFVSYIRHRDETYWKLRESVVHLREKSANLYVKIAKVKRQHEVSTRLTKLASEKDHHTQLEAEKAALEDKILACDKWIDGLDGLYKGYKQRIQDIKNAALTECRKQATHRQNGQNFFDTLPEFGTSHTNGSQWQLPMFGVLAMLVISSCTAPTTTEGLCLVDKTIVSESYQSPLGVEVYPLFSGMEAGNVKFAAITDQHIQPFWTVSIKSQTYFTRVEAKADSAKVKFKSDFNEAFHALPPPSPYYKKTLLFSAIEQHLVPLSQSNSQVKKCVIISDMLENSDTFNFYRFRENPASIMENFDLILAKLDGEFVHQKAMNLTGVDITIVHSPDKENDLLFYYVLQWWQRYLSSKGARVQTVPSLKGGSLLFAEN